MRNGNERKSPSSSSSSPLDCDVGLGLKMPLQPNIYAGDESLFNNQLACGGHVYGPAADAFVLPRSFHAAAFRTPVGGMGASGKALFTASQWQELERQKMIHKYIMASIPVPPQLLLPMSTTPVLPSYPQSNIPPGLDLRYSSNGSDPEPWRCKRTDGKKWRCSRDVAPDQKYCDRHAHKTRTRSRKHVETSSSSHNSINAQRSSSSQQSIPTMASATSYDQSNSIEWFMRGSSITSNQQQWQQLMQQMSSSSSTASTKDYDKNVSLHERQSFTSLNHFNIPSKDTIRPEDQNHPILGSKTGFSSQSHATTRHFIDAWEKESPSSKFSPISSSLTLSMSGGGHHHGNENNMMNSDRDRGEYGNLRGVSWMDSSPPGGPLGEALCLGSNGGYSNYSNTNSSKSSCEEGSYAFNFIG